MTKAVVPCFHRKPPPMLYSQIIKICRVALTLMFNGGKRNTGTALPPAVHMGRMSTDAATQPAPDHFVPETEPPVGTVASFHYRFASGAYSNTGYMLHTPGGWTDSPERPARSWEMLIDLDARNAEIQQRTPMSTAVAVSLEVRIHITPPVDRPAEKARLVKLQQAVYCAAERLGIQTEGASHTELVKAIEDLAFIARSAR